MKMGRWRGRLYATDRAHDFDHEHDRNVRIRQIYETIDRQPYQWIVVLVAGIGFFLDGYTIFVSNIALPMIAYVYFHSETTSLREALINISTLAGTLIGQVTFGILADKNGRKKMYGIELLVVIGATLGVVMCSTGANNSMNVYGWLIWWRIVSGIGVGADYPLSAVITSEFAPTAKRARMMASVFFMQPLGQVSGNIVALLVIIGTRNAHEADPIKAVDTMWRWVIGIGVVPGVIALFFRVAIPETPRFLLDIEDDPIKAEFDATELFGEPQKDLELDGNISEEMSQIAPAGMALPSNCSLSSQPFEGTGTPTSMCGTTVFPDVSPSAANAATLNSSWKFTKADILQYFWKEGNWKTLLGTSLCWLLLDFGFYGIGLSSPQFLAKTWGSLNIQKPSPVWQTTDDPNTTIYDMLLHTSVEALVILNVGSIVGGILLILTANRLNRVALQKYGFIVLAALFIILGTVFITIQKTGAVAVALYIVAQIAFNFGPNGTTYILPAELFPTRYRASCHGISAGAGKLGSILVQLFSAYYKFGGSSPGAAETKRYGTILIIFSVFMLLGAAVTHFCIPDVQAKDRKSKSLEELANGRAGADSQTATRQAALHRSASNFGM